ncbi:hypothetical protein LTS18_010518 [Coniosporium uncinatum]|uniref:Uncharacterized protein n=1 Tax=Coniosporium uncinatum TaxID=93489 RepID=A0ACC3DWH3_9PEZI|nr:hypothetical protein LTS18_010518 [Coniosporium uncinatum]
MHAESSPYPNDRPMKERIGARLLLSSQQKALARAQEAERKAQRANAKVCPELLKLLLVGQLSPLAPPYGPRAEVKKSVGKDQIGEPGPASIRRNPKVSRAAHDQDYVAADSAVVQSRRPTWKYGRVLSFGSNPSSIRSVHPENVLNDQHERHCLDQDNNACRGLIIRPAEYVYPQHGHRHYVVPLPEQPRGRKDAPYCGEIPGTWSRELLPLPHQQNVLRHVEAPKIPLRKSSKEIAQPQSSSATRHHQPEAHSRSNVEPRSQQLAPNAKSITPLRPLQWTPNRGRRVDSGWNDVARNWERLRDWSRDRVWTDGQPEQDVGWGKRWYNGERPAIAQDKHEERAKLDGHTRTELASSTEEGNDCMMEKTVRMLEGTGSKAVEEVVEEAKKAKEGNMTAEGEREKIEDKRLSEAGVKALLLTWAMGALTAGVLSLVFTLCFKPRWT